MPRLWGHVSYSTTMPQGPGSLEHSLLPLHHPVCFCLPSGLQTKQNHLWSQRELPKGCPSSESGLQGQWHNPLKPQPERVPEKRMIWRMILPAQRLGRGPLTRRNKRRISPPGMKPRGKSGAGPGFLLCPPLDLKLVLNPTSQARLRKPGPTTKVYPSWISPLIPKNHVT
jgi:hypothetical protein